MKFVFVILMSMVFSIFVPHLAVASDDPLHDWVELQQKKVGSEKKEYIKKKAEIEKNSEWIQQVNSLSDLKSVGDKGDNLDSDALIIEGRRYNGASIISFLLHVAFSNSLWYEDDSLDVTGILTAVKKQREGYVFPRHGLVNKWNVPIKITLKTLLNDNVVDEQKYEYLRSHIEDISKIYSEATGVDISYVHENFPERSDANVFIILDAKSEIYNAFKNQRSSQYMNENNYEKDFTGVRFTPDMRSQVEGFFVSDSDNNINFAACYLKPSLIGSNLAKVLTTECLTRILGLPEVLKKSDKSILTNWNKEFDDVSELTVLDGIHGNKNFGEDWSIRFNLKLNAVIPRDALPSDMDKKIVSLLYCDSIRAGMDKYETIKAIALNPTCLD